MRRIAVRTSPINGRGVFALRSASAAFNGVVQNPPILGNTDERILAADEDGVM
jgi:hypothetical protein